MPREHPLPEPWQFDGRLGAMIHDPEDGFTEDAEGAPANELTMYCLRYERKTYIAQLEALAVLAAMQTWAQQIAGRRAVLWCMATRGSTTSRPSPTPYTSPPQGCVLRCTSIGCRRRRISPISPLGEATTYPRPSGRSRYRFGCPRARSSRGRQRIGSTMRTRPATISRGRCEGAHWWT